MTNLIHYSNGLDSNETLPLLLARVIPLSHASSDEAHDSVCKSEVGVVVVKFIGSGHLLPHSIIRGDNK